MAMFGKRLGIIYGDQPDFGIPDDGRNGRLGTFGFGIDPDTQSAVDQYAAMPAQPKESGFERFMGKAAPLLGVLGDALLAANGRPLQYAPLRARERQQSLEEAQYQLRRADDNADWYARQEWERRNPKPINNDTVADYEFWRSKLSPEQFSAYVQNKIDPPQYRQGLDGRFYRMEIAPSLPPAPTKPVGKLTPIEPTIHNTPAPALGSNGMPTRVTRDQYQAIVAAKGAAATAEWARRNNIQVGD